MKEWLVLSSLQWPAQPFHPGAGVEGIGCSSGKGRRTISLRPTCQLMREERFSTMTLYGVRVGGPYLGGQIGVLVITHRRAPSPEDVSNDNAFYQVQWGDKLPLPFGNKQFCQTRSSIQYKLTKIHPHGNIPHL